MRIISGTWRSRPLVAPKGDTTRPTADRTRETLFSMLTSRLGSFEGLQVLDLFSGSGALGLEALESNIAKLGAGSQSEVRRGSALMLGPARKPFDLILMDPPYGTGAGAVALDKLARLGWIAPGALISIETGNREDTEVKGFEIDTIRDIGKARITLLRPVGASE